MSESTLPRELYLDLLKKCLTRVAFPDSYKPWLPKRRRRIRRAFAIALRSMLRRSRLDIVRTNSFDLKRRLAGMDHPGEAETMIGLPRLDNLQDCIEQVIRDGIPGDFIETGVWRGGACIFMRGVLKAYDETGRTVWVADSFEGLPRPNDDLYPADKDDKHWTIDALAISLEEVQQNFERYGLLDDQVQFLKGWFSDTLAGAPIQELAILRLDGDMYESTMDAIRPLYPKLQKGGFLIVDDYFLPNCRAAIDDYRSECAITDEIIPIDDYAVYWRKSS